MHFTECTSLRAHGKADKTRVQRSSSKVAMSQENVMYHFTDTGMGMMLDHVMDATQKTFPSRPCKSPLQDVFQQAIHMNQKVLAAVKAAIHVAACSTASKLHIFVSMHSRLPRQSKQ